MADEAKPLEDCSYAEVVELLHNIGRDDLISDIISYNTVKKAIRDLIGEPYFTSPSGDKIGWVYHEKEG